MKLSSAFKYRNLWLGVAMVLVVLHHSGISIPPLQALIDVGYCGVDICLFASGIGCYYSLEKDSGFLRFLKRRVKRLGPVYYCFLLPWLGLQLLSGGFPLKAVLFNLLGIQSFFSWSYHFNWYISALVLFYLLAPGLRRLTNACGAVWMDAGVIAVLAAAGLLFRGNVERLIIVSRLPVFYLGMVYGKRATQGAAITKTGWFAHLLIMFSGIGALWLSFTRFPDLLYQGLYWYPFLLIAPGGCMVLSALAGSLEKSSLSRWIIRPLSTIGIYSFEVYLVHIFLYESVLPGITELFSGVPEAFLRLCSLPVIALGCYLLNRAAGLLSRALQKAGISC